MRGANVSGSPPRAWREGGLPVRAPPPATAYTSTSSRTAVCCQMKLQNMKQGGMQLCADTEHYEGEEEQSCVFWFLFEIIYLAFRIYGSELNR